MNFCKTIPTHLGVAKLFKDMLSFYEVLFSNFHLRQPGFESDPGPEMDCVFCPGRGRLPQKNSLGVSLHFKNRISLFNFSQGTPLEIS